MSTILDALKKAEKKNARETLPGRILSGQPEAAPNKGRVFYMSCLLVLLGVAAVLMLLYGGGRHVSLEVKQGEGLKKGDVKPASFPVVLPEEVKAELVRELREELEKEDKKGGTERLGGRVEEEQQQEKVTFPDLRLSGVLLDAGESLAIVNGKSLLEGETIDGAKVIKIDPDGVQMLYNGEIHSLRVQ